MTTHEGIPVTTPARTILDLAAMLGRRPLERVLDRTELLELTDYPALRAIAHAHPGHRGARKLQSTLDTHHAGTTLTRSHLEERFLTLCREHGLPAPLVNSWPSGKEVDFRFPGHALIVEADSWTHHRSREAFENDRARDALRTRAGYRTLRFTYRQLADDPAAVAATVAPPSERRLDPVHVRAQLLARGLDLRGRLLGAHPLEVLLAGAVLRDPLPREVAGLDLLEDLAHPLTGLVGDDALAAGVVAVLGRVGDREAHPLRGPSRT